MAKGSPIVPVRVPEDTLKEIDDAVERSQTHRKKGGHTRTSFILEAVAEKFAKMERSRKWRSKKNRPPA